MSHISSSFLFFLTFTLLFISIYAQTPCFYPCSTDEDCVNSSGCTSCVSGICNCPSNLTACQIRDDLYQCYNSTTDRCCPNGLSHGATGTCPIALECCMGYGYSTCYDPSTEICCGSLNPSSCEKPMECCLGNNYSTCYTPSSQECCCGNICQTGQSCDQKTCTCGSSNKINII
eukprot:TRINITY_DN14519_c0_g1_i1.p1 TRINITY_DN14519_c0_g1~~TRINITY_DN14519_c0_g1_i1.p1  ORF type:complete len:174 (-),score=44.76 TRINITY_DN14519_c0_g1_i1:157-678(-)